MRGPVINIGTAEFEFNERISTVTQVEDAVCFQTVPIVIIGYATAERGGVRFLSEAASKAPAFADVLS